jgi:hypothetical protein
MKWYFYPGMNVDHTQVLKLAESNNGIITSHLVMNEFKWDEYRVENLFNFMIKEGLVWLDCHETSGIHKKSYYFPSLFSNVYL